MKYAIVILDGAADIPCEALADKTPLEAARKPTIDALAGAGRVGTFAATPEGAVPDTAGAARALLGFAPALPGELPASYFSRFGVRAALVSASPIIQAVARDMGLEIIPIEREEPALFARLALSALGRDDLVCIHLQSPLLASEQRDVSAKIAAIEAADTELVAPLAAALPRLAGGNENEWRLLIATTCYHLAATGERDPAPVPFLISGSWVRSVVQRPYTEEAAAESDLHVERAPELMEYFLFGGLAKVPGARARASATSMRSAE